jgi:hypothetical protein
MPAQASWSKDVSTDSKPMSTTISGLVGPTVKLVLARIRPAASAAEQRQSAHQRNQHIARQLRLTASAAYMSADCRPTQLLLRTVLNPCQPMPNQTMPTHAESPRTFV